VVPRCLTIAGSDSGGGAGVQADLKAFAAAGCFGMSAIVALTAQNTTGVTAVHELPPEFVEAQLEAVFDDLGVDAAKTGMLFSSGLIEAVAAFLEKHRVPLVVDPVMVASSGARLLQDDAVETLVARLFPLATVITPNLIEARAFAPSNSLLLSREELAEELHGLGAAAVVVTGGHGSGCTHSATLAALLARGQSLEDAARGAAEAASRAVAHGLAELGAGEGPVDVIGLRSAV
jgi:hydroxymethylpyrimidine/phosphomethylpyrimidine kinase